MNILDLARSALPNATARAVDRPPPAGTHYRWCVILADGTPFEVCCLPELTLAEVRELYRGATVQPMPDAPGPVATPRSQHAPSSPSLEAL